MIAHDGPAFTRSGRGLGCVSAGRDDPRHTAHPAHTLIGAGAPGLRASMADLVFVPPDVAFADQGSSQSCVGWSVAQAVHVRMRTMGVAPVTPSPLAVYYHARARAAGGPDGLWDGGCNPHDAWESLRETGIVPYAAHPFVRSRVDVAPDPGDYRLAADHRWLRYHWVLTSGRARVTEVVGLLASRRPVVVALRVDQSLEEWHPGDSPWTRTGPDLGGHAVTLIGYDTLALGGRVFVFANSWGTWGDCGFGLLSERALASSECSYLCTPDIDPEEVPR